MGTAIWLVALISLWLVVLLPFARDTRRSMAGLRSIDHFHGAMRVLSRRPDRERKSVVLPAGARVGRVGRPVLNNRPARPRPSRAPKTLTTAQRRRRTLGILSVSAVVTSALAFFTVALLWMVAAFFSWVALVAALVWLRMSARAVAAARARRRRPRPVAAPVQAPVWSPATGPFAVVVPTAEAFRAMPRPAYAPEISQMLPIVQPMVVGAAPSEMTAADVAPEEWQEWTEEPFAGVRVLDLTTPGGWRRRRLFESADEPIVLEGPEEVPLGSRHTG